MPKNPFSGKRPGMQLSPLLQLLQQQAQEPQQQPGLEVPFAQASQEHMLNQQPPMSPFDPAGMQRRVQQDQLSLPQQKPSLFSGIKAPSLADAMESGYANVNPLGKLGAMGARMAVKGGIGATKTGLEAAGGSLGELIQSNPGLLKELGLPEQMAGAMSQPATRPPVAPPPQEGGGGEGGGEGSLFDRLNQEKMQSAQGFGAVMPPGINEAVQDSVKQYGIAQGDFEKAQFALKQEFQDTPEIDNALNYAHQSLAEARANRKQPSAWDFIAMALMNLSGIHPATSAAMVLGLDDQGRREGMLEDRIFNLEDARAGAKMQGRRDLRGMEMQQGRAEQEAMQRAQEMALRQGNLDREFGFKQQDQVVDLLRAISGQESETERMSMDSAVKKKAGDRREKIFKALNLDQILNGQQPPQPPADKRQSRMFGGFQDQFA